jgi:hypothetical protein
MVDRASENEHPWFIAERKISSPEARDRRQIF